MKSINIAIDGPAGAGKSTIAKMLSKELGMLYADTGALYRALAVHVVNSAVDAGDEALVENICKDVSVDIKFVEGAQHVLLSGTDITGSLRTEKVGNTASTISAYSYIREKLLSMQRNLARENDVIMDGRDIGTNVLPDAGLKIYLTASSETRAKRRYDELLEKGENPDFESIKNDIEKRDMQDKSRKIAPLKKAEDAVLVDSSQMTIDEVVSFIKNLVKERFEQ